jgi:hypothetical protein
VDDTKFSLIREDSDSTLIHRGKVIDDQIVMEDQSIEIYAKFRYPKLEDNHLYGFQRVHNEENNSEEWHFQKYALDEKPVRKVSSVHSWLRDTEVILEYFQN